MDKEYMDKRNRMLSRKPKHFGDGLAQGTLSLLKGV